MEKKIYTFFIAVVTIILFTPFVFTILKIKVTPVNKMEKEISLNFRRNFPLRADLFKAYYYIKKDFFGKDPIEGKVVDANNGWKFLGDEFSNAFVESKGLLVFSDNELRELKRILTNRNDWLKEQGIAFYLSVAPSKLSVYGDMIPIRQYERNTKMQQVDSLCQAIGVNYINLGADFPDPNKVRLYHKTDSHWNDYAGFSAFNTLIHRISKDFPNTNFNPYSLDDITINTTIDPIGDLNEMLRIEKKESWSHFDFKEAQAAQGIEEKSLPIRKGYHKNPSFYELRYESPINDLKLMTINDSFFGYIRRYMVNNFGNSLLLWDFKFDKEIILSEKPDVVVYEIVERDLDFIFVSE